VAIEALMKVTLADAKEKGLKRIELMVPVDNPKAKQLYERFGFVEEALCKRPMWVDGEYKDSHLMAVLYD
jgi:RimJ/RimL family protein N-acetyltransferase